jgi:hypothetical protein
MQVFLRQQIDALATDRVAWAFLHLGPTARRVAQIIGRGVTDEDVARILAPKLTEREFALILAGEPAAVANVPSQPP